MAMGKRFYRQALLRKTLVNSSFVVAAALLIISCCAGCGYRFCDREGLAANYHSISVPYIIGDEDGSLTAAVVKAIVQSGAFEYRSSGGALILNVTQIDEREENIGFRYDRKKRGKLTHEIIPTETRIVSVVEVSVIDAASSCVVLGPARLAASVDFDHDYYFSRNGVNIFSLGQLIDIEAAYDAVQAPLNRALALKIADFLKESW